MNKFLISIFFLVSCTFSFASQKEMKVVATAYSPHPRDNGNNSKTKMGTKYVPRFTIAVDPKFIKLGSTIEIPELGIKGKALDIGGSIKGRRIDICLASRSLASRFGRRSIQIIVTPPFHQDDKKTSKRNSISSQPKKGSKNRSS